MHAAKTVVVAATLCVAVQVAVPVPCVAEAVATPSQDGRTFATIVLNHEARGEYVVRLANGDVFVQADDLRRAGLLVPPAVARSADGYVRLADLAPAIAATFDPQGPLVVLDANKATALTRHSSVALGGAPPEGTQRAENRSGYLNYGLRAAGGGAWSGAQELALSDAVKTLYSSGSFDARGYRRGLTNVTWDHPSTLRRVIAGDTFADGGDLGSTLVLGGVSVSRAYNLDPYDARVASPVVYGAVLAPSTADIRVNGQLVRTVELPPGTFDLRNLPASGGLTDASIVVHDAFGRTQIFSAKYYGAASVLKRGTTDYSFSAGEVRGAAGSGDGYQGFAAVGRYAFGVTEQTTLGGHAEFASGLGLAVVTFDHSGRLGVTHAGLAESRSPGTGGVAASFGHTFGTAHVWGTASLQAASAGYITVAQRGIGDRQTFNAQASIGLRPFAAQYTTTVALTETRSLLAGRSRQLTWEHALPLRGGGSLFVSTGVVRGAVGTTPAFSLLLQRPLGTGGQTTFNESIGTEGAGIVPVTEIRRSSQASLGLQYDARIQPTGSQLSSGTVGLHTAVGNLDSNYSVQRGGGSAADLAWSGSFAFAGGYAHVGQPIADGFTLVKVDGGSAARVLADNQDMGTTDRSGIVIVPTTRSYYAQRIGISDDNGPVNMNVSSQDTYVMPGYRQGALVRFRAAVIRAIVGVASVREGGRSVVPVFGELRLDSPAGTFTSNLDQDGRFYIENAAAGTYQATIRYAAGDCRFIVVLPATTTPEYNIGSITCARS